MLENSVRQITFRREREDSFDLNSGFGTLRFRYRLVWMVGLSVEVKLRFRITPMLCGWDLNGGNLLALHSGLQGLLEGRTIICFEEKGTWLFSKA